MRITDAAGDLHSLYPGGAFDPGAWRAYMDALLPGIADEAEADMRACCEAGYTWDEHYLPVLQAAWENAGAREGVRASFRAVTQGLPERIAAAGLRPVHADVTLYLGLCSGAGWVTQVAGRDAVLLGIEKIIELGWGDLRAMTGLILHELGHVYHAQQGVLLRPELSGAQAMLWQLLTEGVAMVFEQRVMGDEDYFHQDADGWRDALAAQEARLARDFASELPTMTHYDQRYFGDWVRWEGLPDAGYYLGARFVRHVCRTHGLDAVLRAEITQAEAWFADYLRRL